MGCKETQRQPLWVCEVITRKDYWTTERAFLDLGQARAQKKELDQTLKGCGDFVAVRIINLSEVIGPNRKK